MEHASAMGVVMLSTCALAGANDPVLQFALTHRTASLFFRADLIFMAKLTVKDLEVRGKRVLVRVDYNVPMEEKDGQMIINDVTRIKETLPTLELLMEKGARIILASHLGRPKGKRDPSLSLRPVAATLKPGDILLLENVRYYNEEEANDPAFAEKLATVAEVYVNDAFGAAHRAHASSVGVP